MRREKGKAMAEHESQLKPLKRKEIETSGQLLFVDDSSDEGKKRHDQIINEWIQRDILNDCLTQKEIGERG